MINTNLCKQDKILPLLIETEVRNAHGNIAQIYDHILIVRLAQSIGYINAREQAS